MTALIDDAMEARKWIAPADSKLNEYDHDEWRDIAKRVRPDLTEDEFERLWARFIDLKERRGLS